MKKIINIFLAFLLLVIIIGCIIPYFLPKSIEIQASKEFDNPISEVFLEFNEMENYGSWGMFFTEDSVNTHVEYFSPYKGVGSSLTWTNKKDKNIGRGEYRIIKSEINKFIKSQIIFIDTGVICYEDVDFSSNSGITNVNVLLKTDDFSYFKRIFAYLYHSKFEDQLKISLNKLHKKLSRDINPDRELLIGEIEYVDVNDVQLLAIKNETSTNPEDIYKNMHKSLNEISKYLVDSLRYIPTDIKNPIAYYSQFDTINKIAVFYSGYPVKIDMLPSNNKNQMSLLSIPAGKAIYTPINGKVADHFNSRYSLEKYSKENHVTIKNQYWEEYQDFPLSYDDIIVGRAYNLIVE